MTDPVFSNVLITGAAQRIGRTIALDLAAHGFGVAVHYGKSQEAAENLVKSIRDAGGRATSVKADLAIESEVAAIIPTVAKALGPLTVLVNNASQFEHDTIETANRQSWDRHMEVNLRAPFVLSQIFADQVPEGIEGNIVNIIDQRVLNLTPFFMTYTVSKTALWTLTQTMAMALAPKVRVNGIGPGPTLKNVRQTEQEFVRQWTELPLRRRVLPEEISDAVRYILLAPSMTGQMIALDGGQHLGWGAKSNMMAPIE